MKAYRAAVLAEVATNEAALPPEQVAILQRCVGASTHKSMTALQQELRGEDVAAQRALAVALRRRIAAVRTEGLCLQLLEMSLGDQDVATAEQFKRLFTPVAAVVRATQQPVGEEAVGATGGGDDGQRGGEAGRGDLRCVDDIRLYEMHFS